MFGGWDSAIGYATRADIEKKEKSKKIKEEALKVYKLYIDKGIDPNLVNYEVFTAINARPSDMTSEDLNDMVAEIEKYWRVWS